MFESSKIKFTLTFLLLYTHFITQFNVCTILWLMDVNIFLHADEKEKEEEEKKMEEKEEKYCIDDM